MGRNLVLWMLRGRKKGILLLKEIEIEPFMVMRFWLKRKCLMERLKLIFLK
jgi:hypothetical protein